MMVFFVSAFGFMSVLLAPTGLAASEKNELDYRVEVVAALVGPKDALFLQSRAATIPGSPPTVVLTTQRTGRTGTHNYQDMYQGPRRYTTIVARCAFDGKTLTYKKHGSELTIPRDRGLYEPSVTAFEGRYFLTMRADHSAFVARSENGIDYDDFREWTFDDGKPLGSYNTQQHWVMHTDGLFLVYTRKGAGNDHIVRHRAPLFMARVDPERLCVLRSTERVLIPENNATLGNFGVTQVSPEETWVVTSETPTATRQGDRNRVFVARILWTRPSRNE